MNYTLNFTTQTSFITPSCIDWCKYQLDSMVFLQTHHGLSLIVWALTIQGILNLNISYEFLSPKVFAVLYDIQQYFLIGFLIIQVFNI